MRNKDAQGCGSREVHGVILAGGEGRRLRPLTYYFQKCMIPVGGRQKPLLEHILLLLRRHGIVDVKLLVGYKHEQIVNYFNDGDRFGLKIDYFIDEPTPGGSAGALLNAAEKGAFNGSDSLLVYYGDIISNIDLSALLKQHFNSKSVATLAVSQGFTVPVGVADVEGTIVKKWTEKPRIDIYAGIGIVALSPEAIEQLHGLAEDGKKIDIMGDLVPFLIEEGYAIDAYVTDAFWYDVGSLEKYEKLSDEMLAQMYEMGE